MRRRVRRWVRRVLAVVGVLLLAVALVIGPISVYALVSPYASVPVPASCDDDLAAVTAAHRVTVPGVGEGIAVASDGSTTLAAVPGPDGRTAGGVAVVMVSGAVVARLPVASRAVAGGVRDGIAYLFDDKIGFVVDARTGVPLPRLFESDNYRGLLVDGGVERVQTDIEVTAVGLGGRPFFTATLPFGAVVDGCLLAVP